VVGTAENLRHNGATSGPKEDDVRILLVEDDKRVAAAMGSALTRRGYDVEHAATASAALTAAPCDLVLLDLSLPDGDGIEVCRTLRRRSTQLGIIAVTARGEERDRVVGLRMGADDYVVKPFSMDELQARIEAVLRRAAYATPEHTVIAAGRVEIDVPARAVTVDGRTIALTRKEFDILVSLARQPGLVVTRDRILLDVWQTTWVARHTVEVHVGSLRSKLGDPRLVEVVRGVGYRLRSE
jgi:DNA-binding response OmpR family regulator